MAIKSSLWAGYSIKTSFSFWPITWAVDLRFGQMSTRWESKKSRAITILKKSEAESQGKRLKISHDCRVKNLSSFEFRKFSKFGSYPWD